MNQKSLVGFFPMFFCLITCSFYIPICELPVFVVLFLALVFESSESLLIQIFLLLYSLFFSFWYSNYAYAIPFKIVPHFLDILCFTNSVFLFAFQFEKVLLSYLWAHCIFFSSVPSLQMSPAKPVPFVTIFLISNINFYSILTFPSLCRHYLSVLSCFLFYPLETLTYWLLFI